MAFRYDILTLFPALFDSFFRESLMGKAVERALLEVHLHNWRDDALDRHHTVDDAPFGGGAGLVLKPDVLGRCVDRIRAQRAAPAPLVVLSPAGTPLTQSKIERWAEGDGLILVCGRYEGFDARFEATADEVVSLGDYVLNGGEVAAMAIVEATARLRPGVVGNAESLGGLRHTAAGGESHSAGLLEYPQYTRPRVWGDKEVPEILLSGDHRRIAAWRLEQARQRTQRLRPDLWRKSVHSPADSDE